MHFNSKLLSIFFEIFNTWLSRQVVWLSHIFFSINCSELYFGSGRKARFLQFSCTFIFFTIKSNKLSQTIRTWITSKSTIFYVSLWCSIYKNLCLHYRQMWSPFKSNPLYSSTGKRGCQKRAESLWGIRVT